MSAPVTIGDLVRGRRLLWAYCRECGRERDIDPATLPLPGEYPRSRGGKRMRCSACGSRKVHTAPELYPGGIEAMRARWGANQPSARPRAPGETALARKPRASTHRSSARFLARVLSGAAPAPHPGFIAPCEPKLRRTPPSGDRWLSEIKHDGYRVQAHLEGGRARLFTRRGYDWTPRFAALASALADLPANSLILDGEVIVQGETGVADFDALQADLASGRSERMVYFGFDLLYLDGFDLRKAPLIERKRVLATLLDEAKSECFHLAQHLEVEPALVFDQACAMGLEGIVCKLRDAPYRSGARASWLKIKCFKHGVFPIVGFIPAPGAIAALHLARREGKALAYAGRAGTGFTQKSARELREVLDALATDRPPVQGAPLRPKSTWVRPELSAAIQYTAMTREGLLRHAAFKGLQRRRGRT